MLDQDGRQRNDGTANRYVVRRAVDKTPREVFDLLTDPARHQETEPNDWVGNAIDGDTLTHVGQVFGIEMFHVNAGSYEMHNKVVALEQDRTVAWEPGQFGPDGNLETGGWTWRYELAAEGDGTMVTLTYDWDATPESLRKEFGLPPFGPEFLEQSLNSLATALGSSETGR